MNATAPATEKIVPLGESFRVGVREALAQCCAGLALDGVLLLSPANVGYASGFFFSVNERPIGLYVPVKGEPILFIPELERENAESVEGASRQIYYEFSSTNHPILWMVKQSRAKRIAIDTLEARLLSDLQPMLDKLVLEDIASPLRYIKTPQELALTREAVKFADICLERLFAEGADIISQGGTELDLMADCVGHARAALKAAHEAAFTGTKMGITCTVHSGPRAALPHGTVIARKPQRGEPVIAGIGASLGGYHSESGITIIVGEMSAEHRRVMAAMRACNDGAIAALVPGNTCDAVNAAAMAPLEAAGLGAAIRHRIGHGMGVEGHEAPWLNPGEQTRIAAGMVFSNEPGIYRPNLDGYRTINTMIVHPDHVEIPSRFQTNHPIEDRVFAL